MRIDLAIMYIFICSFYAKSRLVMLLFYNKHHICPLLHQGVFDIIIIPVKGGNMQSMQPSAFRIHLYGIPIRSVAPICAPASCLVATKPHNMYKGASVP